MTGSPEVITGILNAITASRAAFMSLHDEEHLWEVEGFKKLKRWFDVGNKDLWKWHHVLLKRLYKLGGRPEGTTTDPVDAFSKALASFQSLHDACQAIYDAAEKDDDYVTIDELATIQTEVESWIVSAEKKLRQIDRLKDGFMPEQL